MDRISMIKCCNDLDKNGFFKESELIENFIKLSAMPLGNDLKDTIRNLLPPSAKAIFDKYLPPKKTQAPTPKQNQKSLREKILQQRNNPQIPWGDYGKFKTKLEKYEGGLSNRPLKDDPGGLTNKGVTDATYNRWRKSKGLGYKSVRYITDEEVNLITKNLYWDKIQGDFIPHPIAIVLADWKFLGGSPVKELQKLIGVSPDGLMGTSTVKALWKYTGRDNEKAKQLALKLLDSREKYMRRLPNASSNRGWWIRLNDMRKTIMAL
jgi:hypothetical protein